MESSGFGSHFDEVVEVMVGKEGLSGVSLANAEEPVAISEDSSPLGISSCTSVVMK